MRLRILYVNFLPKHAYVVRHCVKHITVSLFLFISGRTDGVCLKTNEVLMVKLLINCRKKLDLLMVQMCQVTKINSRIVGLKAENPKFYLSERITVTRMKIKRNAPSPVWAWYTD
jgi:hypothetical protein